MKEIKLSVIIPVYNTEPYLKRCLDSVIQAVEFMKDTTEILVINDGSKGNTDEIMLPYLSKYQEYIYYCKKENSGLGDTKNYGILKAKGKYISFIDSDDYIAEEFYQDVFKKIDKEQADVVICDWEAIGEDISQNHRVHAKNPKIKDDKWGCIDISIMPSSCNKVILKDYFKDLTFPKGLRYEDLATTLIILLTAKKIVYIPNMNYKYFLSPNSIMRSGFDEKKFQMIDIFEILFERVEALNIPQEDKDKALYSAYTWRLNKELLLPLSKVEHFWKRYQLTRVFCKKIKPIHQKMNKNPYFIKNELQSGRKLRKFYTKLVHFFFFYQFAFLLNGILKKALKYIIV